MCNGVAQLNRWPVLYWVLLPAGDGYWTALYPIIKSHNTQEYTGRGMMLVLMTLVALLPAATAVYLRVN